MADASIVLDNLSKRYKGAKAPALDRVSLQVQPGEVYGFLGANGAGKSTTIRTLLNFIQPTGGTASIMGLDIVKKSVDIKRQVGYLAGDVALPGKVTGQQFLSYMAALQPLPEKGYQNRLVKDFQADPSKPLVKLSKGNRQKFGIIQALMHQPDVLILDEPTSGLDPLMQEVFFDAILAAKRRGACVFFSSHNLAEVQRICDRVGFIRAGRLIREQSLAQLASSASHTFDIIFKSDTPLGELRAIDGATVMTGRAGHAASVAVPASGLTRLFKVLAEHPVQHFQQREINLEEEFLSFYKDGPK